MNLVDVSNLSLHEHGISALQPLSFVVPAHQKLAIAGESGAGKSTLLQLIAGLIEPSSGSIRIAGSKVRGPAIALVPGHPGVAYLSQKSELPGFLRVEQVLRYANKRPEAEALAVYKLCRIDHLMGRTTKQLSGGEQQRVALARLLLGGPQLLLLDEPFSNLDRVHKRQLQDIIREVGERLGITCILVSHDAADVLAWADEILVLERGRMVQHGSPQHLYHQPASEYTAALFGDYHLLRGFLAQILADSPLPAGAALLVRPEQFRLGPPTRKGLTGVVQAVRFYGSYTEVVVQLAGAAIRVRVGAAGVAVGEVVGVKVVAGGGWVLPG